MNAAILLTVGFIMAAIGVLVKYFRSTEGESFFTVGIALVVIAMSIEKERKRK